MKMTSKIFTKYEIPISELLKHVNVKGKISSIQVTKTGTEDVVVVTSEEDLESKTEELKGTDEHHNQ